MGSPSFGSLIKFGAVLGAGTFAYLRFIRPHVLHWGATPDETGAFMPGDGLLPDATLQTTRAITIDAAPEYVWPWLVQMGPKPRAGAYTYDWIERMLGIDIESSDRILPQFQHMETGDFLPLNEKDTSGLLVKEVEPRKALVMEWIPAGSTWSFALYPQDGGTRLVSRNRIQGAGLRFWLTMIPFMEPGSLVMERRMLIGIKQRAERLAVSEHQPA